MRAPALLAVAALLLLPATALAHGDGPIGLRLSDQGCVVTEPPCIFADAGAAVKPGESNTVELLNELDTTVDLMIHLDADGNPGAMIGGLEPAGPGSTATITFDVPEDATGVWYMTLESGSESARLFGGLDGHAGGESEDSPGLGVVVLFGVLTLVGVVARRR